MVGDNNQQQTVKIVTSVSQEGRERGDHSGLRQTHLK